MSKSNQKGWMKSGAPWIWMNAGAVTLAVVVTLGLMGIIAVRGLTYFWPADLIQATYSIPATEPIPLIGKVVDEEDVLIGRLRAAGLPIAQDEKRETLTRELLKVGNREVTNADFTWVLKDWLVDISTPKELVVLERYEWGDFYGRLKAIKLGDKTLATGQDAWIQLQALINKAEELHQSQKRIEREELNGINQAMESLRLTQRRYELDGAWTPEHQAEVAAKKIALDEQYKIAEEHLLQLSTQLKDETAVFSIANGQEVSIKVRNIVRAYQPNAMSTIEKMVLYGAKLKEFVSAEPREANTEGGVFPAIFGTVILVMIMAVLVTPFGIIAALYLREYAKQGFMTRLIRIAVNNLAGVPAIVYGVFGLGFFVYILGGSIDQLFFPEALPSPTLGTPGLMWSALTLAILTMPVVIVATEEGLARVPKMIREGSLALGASKAETLWKIVIPMASPAMMTGLILAIARAAGEVAPLMLVGVVKLAPSLPLDGSFPYLHLERKFMHLGFHIYDVGFQSPNVEAARPLVYATALLLVLVIVLLNIAAVVLRNRLREKYKALDS